MANILKILIFSLLLTGCGDVRYNASKDHAIRWGVHIVDVLWAFNFFGNVNGQVVIENLGDIQERCSNDENALPYHYNDYIGGLDEESNVEMQVLRCMIVHEFDPLRVDPFTQGFVLYITDGNKEHLCEETMLGIMESLFAGGPPRNVWGDTRNPFAVADAWCEKYSEDYIDKYDDEEPRGW